MISKTLLLVSAILFAQENAKSPSLIPELSTVVQLGSFGLIVYVVIIMYPREAKAARDERVAREAAAVVERSTRDKLFSTLANVLQDRFEERNSRMVNAVEAQTAALARVLERGTSRIEHAVESATKEKEKPNASPG